MSMLDDRDSRQLESLLKSYGELQIIISKVQERQAISKESRAKLERDLVETRENLTKSITELRTQMNEGFVKMEKQLSDRRWSPSQYALIIVALISGLSTVLTVVLTRAPG